MLIFTGPAPVGAMEMPRTPGPADAMASVVLETVCRVQRPQGQLGVLFGDQHTHLDFRRRDHLDIDSLVGQGLKHALGDAGVAAHPDADDRHLHHVRVVNQIGIPEGVAQFLDDADGAAQIALGHRERQVGRLAVRRYVLDDHIHVDTGLGQGPEDAGGDAGPAAIPVQYIGEIGLWIAAVLTIITGYDYLRAGLKHMTRQDTAEKGERRPAEPASVKPAKSPGPLL